MPATTLAGALSAWAVTTQQQRTATDVSDVMENMLYEIVSPKTLCSKTGSQDSRPREASRSQDRDYPFSAGALRPVVLRDPSLDSAQRSVARWFDTTAFLAATAISLRQRGAKCPARRRPDSGRQPAGVLSHHRQR